jgi:membrane-associated protein
LLHSALIPWLDPNSLIEGFGAWALLGVCVIIFAETGLLIGFLLPGDTLLIITGLLTFPGAKHLIHIDIWWVALAIGFAAFLGGEVGYLIGKKAGPRIFERRETGLFSVENVKRTNAFFTRFGAIAVILARFVPVVRTFAPIAAGVGHMNYRKYSLYNIVGALIWAAGLTVGGYLLGYIPPVATFVSNYIDVILLGAVVLTLIPTIYHYVRSTVKARRANRAGAAVPTDDEVALPSEVFDRKPEL